MLLNNGTDVNVVGQINIDQQPHLIVKLTNSCYVNASFVNFIVLPQSDFKDYTDQIHNSSLEVVES